MIPILFSATDVTSSFGTTSNTTLFILCLSAIAILGFAGVIRSKRRQLLPGLAVLTKAESDALGLTPDFIQDVKNRAHIHEILEGNVIPLDETFIQKTLDLFLTWQTTQRTLLRSMNPVALKELGALHRAGTTEYTPSVTDTITDMPHGYELFMADVFTEPFPSTHDMDDWHMTMLINDICMTKNIFPEVSKDFLFLIKNKFVNHEMVQAIFHVDVYRKIHTK